ncbi:MAG: PorT family protein, partial [Prevotellaceae bacterium]|nr:PorT family protein [Prevotellaceae bacterium]
MKFNEDIITQIQNYEMNLPENDWEILSQKLDNKQRKSLPLWYWAAAASVALVIGFGFLANNFDKIENGQTQDARYKAQDTRHETQDTRCETQDNTDKIITITIFDKSSYCYTPIIEDLSAQKSENDNQQINESANQQITKSTNQQINKSTNQQLTIEDAEKLMQETPQIVNRKSKIVDKSYASLLASVSPAGFMGAQKVPLMRAPAQNFIYDADETRVIARTSHSEVKHDLPLTFGLNFGIPIAKRLYFNTGINYTYIHSRTSIYNIDNQQLASTDDQNLHYLGIPAMFAYRVIDGRIFKLYIAAGGTAEKGLLETHNTKNFDTENTEFSSDIPN